MILLIEVAIAVFLGKLLWNAFQGSCNQRGVSNSTGALQFLKFLFWTAVFGGIGIILLGWFLWTISTPHGPVPIN